MTFHFFPDSCNIASFYQISSTKYACELSQCLPINNCPWINAPGAKLKLFQRPLQPPQQGSIDVPNNQPVEIPEVAFAPQAQEGQSVLPGQEGIPNQEVPQQDELPYVGVQPQEEFPNEGVQSQEVLPYEGVAPQQELPYEGVPPPHELPQLPEGSSPEGQQIPVVGQNPSFLDSAGNPLYQVPSGSAYPGVLPDQSNFPGVVPGIAELNIIDNTTGTNFENSTETLVNNTVGSITTTVTTTSGGSWLSNIWPFGGGDDLDEDEGEVEQDQDYNDEGYDEWLENEEDWDDWEAEWEQWMNEHNKSTEEWYLSTTVTPTTTTSNRPGHGVTEVPQVVQEQPGVSKEEWEDQKQQWLEEEQVNATGVIEEGPWGQGVDQSQYNGEETLGQPDMWGAEEDKPFTGDDDYWEPMSYINAPVIAVVACVCVVVILLLLIFVGRKMANRDKAQYRPLKESFAGSSTYHEDI